MVELRGFEPRSKTGGYLGFYMLSSLGDLVARRASEPTGRRPTLLISRTSLRWRPVLLSCWLEVPESRRLDGRTPLPILRRRKRNCCWCLLFILRF